MTDLSAHFYAPLNKIESQDDGTIKIAGIATMESVDLSGETILASAVKAAIPDFLRHGTGPLREMHGHSAAGTVDAVEVDGKVTKIYATVVDDEAIKKVRHGVYKGFSIGGKTLERAPTNRKIITKIRWTELSLVDSPCHPKAVFELLKIAGAPTIADALAIMSPEERALVLTKAALRLPISTAKWGF